MKMNGIKMSNCRFYVNEPEKTVVCVIPHTRDMMINFMHEHFNFSDMYISWMLTNEFENKLMMPNSFIGKAVCSHEDTWDEETGKLIAFSRAKDKCYKSFFKRANNLVQAIDRRLGNMLDMFNDFGGKLDAKREALEAKIEEKVEKNKEG